MKSIGEVFPPPAGPAGQRKLVYGVGHNDWKGPVKQDGRHWYVYDMWKGMLRRAYDPKYSARFPTYAGVTVCEEWHLFSSFARWLAREPHFGDGALDKDLIVLRNTVYCPARCLMIPQWLNLLATDSDATRGAWPVGVDFHKRSGKFRARVCVGSGAKKQFGSYATPEEAAAVARKAKLAYVESRRDEIEAVRQGLYACVVAKVMDVYRHG